ncbi:hypothetical protein NYE48_24095 [Paenibacillus sp. FSL M7-1455]|jgi:hypothetical protein|uniref:Lantibiotic biosynthesis protein n=1 Tax=Paenibacillus cookii TaxID=157839 RepID=A0ABQ4LWM6_9BACL|nr:hypothetical protein [Paenibacillus cookii]GIO67672.1 hypothetical protein J21TS3_24930 [Paenibacillus cookii]
MRLRTISCFLYDSEASASLLRGIVRYIQAGSLKNAILQKSWVNGFHVKTTLPVSEADQGLERMIRRTAERYAKPRSAEEYEKYEKMLHKLAGMERYSGDYLPLCRDGEVVVKEEERLTGGNPLCSPRINYGMELLKSQLLADIYEDWNKLSEDRQNVEFAKIFLITGSGSPGGLKVGYLSLRSNFEYFKTQIEAMKKNPAIEAKIRAALLGRSEVEKEFIADGVQKFSNGIFEREFLFGRFKIFVHSLSAMLAQAYDGGELEVEKLTHGDDFFERHDEVSEFHRTFYSNPQFLRHYHDKGFIVYRFVASALYSLMPLLGISSLRRQRITGLVAECVESGFDMDWRAAYRYLEMKMAGDTDYGKLAD